MSTAVHPIGAAAQPGAAWAVRFAHGSLLSSLAAWRRRACSIALGNCGNALIDPPRSRAASVVFHQLPEPHRTVTKYADYLELRAQRAAAELPESVAADDRPFPIRIWPIHRPVIDAEIRSDRSHSGEGSELGNYLDTII